LFDAMINEANASSSACRLWRVPQVETSAPPLTDIVIIARFARAVKSLSNERILKTARRTRRFQIPPPENSPVNFRCWELF
jgi:hypothetical protein